MVCLFGDTLIRPQLHFHSCVRPAPAAPFSVRLTLTQHGDGCSHMSASYVYEGQEFDLAAAIAAVAAEHLDDMDGDLEPNWPDAERRLRTFDSEEDEPPE
jgi:hypothetical protein